MFWTLLRTRAESTWVLLMLLTTDGASKMVLTRLRFAMSCRYIKFWEIEL